MTVQEKQEIGLTVNRNLPRCFRMQAFRFVRLVVLLKAANTAQCHIVLQTVADDAKFKLQSLIEVIIKSRYVVFINCNVTVDELPIGYI